LLGHSVPPNTGWAMRGGCRLIVRIATRSGKPGDRLAESPDLLEAASRRGSAERAVDGDLVQSVLENGELLLVELRGEQFRDPAEVDRSGLGEARHAGVGQRDDDTACVGIGVGSPDEPFLDQPGYTPGHA